MFVAVSPSASPNTVFEAASSEMIGRCCSSKEWRLLMPTQSYHTTCKQEASIDRLLNKRSWLLREPDSRIDNVVVLSCAENGSNLHNFQTLQFRRTRCLDELRTTDKNVVGTFSVVRDDLLHPLVGGNKTRKLDALIPYLQSRTITDVVTCGGCQSAHAAAVAVACAEHGMTAHLLLRGEQLAVPTGYNLISGLYGNVTYIPRLEYVDRETMLKKHAQRIAGTAGSLLWLHGEYHQGEGLEDAHKSIKGEADKGTRKKVAVVEEGAGDATALLGLIRLVRCLRDTSCLSGAEKLQIVVDTGTGTTAVGLAVGIALLGLRWEVIGIMLADTREGYERHKTHLVSEFVKQFGIGKEMEHSLDDLSLVWRERQQKRRFGKVLKGEVSACKEIARQTGILLDPIYTLAAWEVAVELSLEATGKVLMLHTGGTLGLFGLAQRYPDEFFANLN